MRVLLVNKFFYNRGGAEVVTMTLREALLARGIEVGVFAMDYRSNQTVPNLYTAPEVTFKTGGMPAKLRFGRRTLGGNGVKAAFRRALAEFRPDVVHLHNIHSYISPVVARMAHEHGCRVVWTLHDYKLLCPAYSCLNRGKVCERCFLKKGGVLHERCFKESTSASAMAWLEALRWNRSRLERWTDAFVCPSRFMREKMVAGGFDEAKLHVISNFLDPAKSVVLEREPVSEEREPFLFYAGRMSEEKGVGTLVEVMSHLPYRLLLAGKGPMLPQYRERWSACENIIFLGQLSPAAVSWHMGQARAVVVPSECYENNPLSLIEARCAGTPVLGTRIGGIPELIDESCGLVVEPFDSAALSNGIEKIMGTDYDHTAIARTARGLFSAERHLERLLPLYSAER